MPLTRQASKERLPGVPSTVWRPTGTYEEVNATWRSERHYPRCKESKILYRSMFDFRQKQEPGPMQLPCTLTNYLRACAHTYADRLSLLHESKGEGKQRHVLITLTPEVAAEPVSEKLSLDPPKKQPKAVDPAAVNIRPDREFKKLLDACAGQEAAARIQHEVLRLRLDELRNARRREEQQEESDDALQSTVKEIEEVQADAARAATEAMGHFEERREGKQIEERVNLHMYNILLNVLSNAGLIEQFFVVFECFEETKMKPDTATIVALIKACAANRQTERAYKALLEAESSAMKLKLRCYSMVLKAFAENGEAQRAEEVFAKLVVAGFNATEEEYCTLIQVNMHNKQRTRVEELLIEMGDCAAGELLESSIAMLEGWFGSAAAGEWTVARTTVDPHGRCSCNGGQLRSIEPTEEDLAALVRAMFGLGSSMASHKKAFEKFDEYLKEHGPWDMVIDGANIGFCNQSWDGGEFSMLQVMDMTMHLVQQNKTVLLVLHQKHIDKALKSEDRAVRHACETIKPYLYVPLRGTNDDWYWLYAAAVGKSMAITNDQMRDHNFQMLSPKHFLKWKERHQAFYNFVGPYRGTPKVYFPAEYSACIQQALDGSAWYFPQQGTKKWLCAYKSVASPTIGKKRPREEEPAPAEQ
eukprot:TRINITY_DN3898_c0_g1_i1.p1 TRINITY_DN3898_c0_g1~~TRINITY_DN3898_c0_g1_i1.p1  ORF type:complete len:644 (-),score=183.28 TRINITY_DN3898_c0_g1_i1:170-2101(-)